MAMSRSFGGTLLTTRSPMRISPAVMFSSPAIMRSSVDLPQPDGPTSTTNSPSSISDIDAVDDLDRSEGLSDVADLDGSHAVPPGMLLGPLRTHRRVRPWASLQSANLRPDARQHSLAL